MRGLDKLCFPDIFANMKPQFHTFSVAPRYTSAEAEQTPTNVAALGPIKVGDTVYFTEDDIEFIVKVSEVHATSIIGSYQARSNNGDEWNHYSEGSFVLKYYTRHADEISMARAAREWRVKNK